LVQIAPSNAQSISPAGHYFKKSGGAGEMRVEKSEDGWRVFVKAAGYPRGGATAADCGLIAIGAIEGNTFRGEIKYTVWPEDFKISPDNAVEVGHNLTITFAPHSATLPDGQYDVVAAGCPDRTGLFGHYTKTGK
jgi:hypothetical protein